MSDLVPNKHHLQEVLFFSFHSKKTAAKAHRKLKNVLGNVALTEKTRHDWFRCFKDIDFDVDDYRCKEWLKIFKDAELKELLDNDSLQMR